VHWSSTCDQKPQASKAVKYPTGMKVKRVSTQGENFLTMFISRFCLVAHSRRIAIVRGREWLVERQNIIT
jgi:hypothetical protein